MAHPSLLHDWHEQAEAQYINFGPDVRIVGVYESYEIEYAAMRKTCGAMDCAAAALLEVTGADHIDFLQRMMARDIKSMAPGQSQRMVLLTAKGRIFADCRVMRLEGRCLIEVDLHRAQPLLEELDKLNFGEQVSFNDLSADYQLVRLIGPDAPAAAAAGFESDRLDALTPHNVLEREQAIVYRDDDLGLPGIHGWLEKSIVAAWWQRVVGGERARAIGWLAYNVARIEAARPMFHIDFGPDTQPHETGLASELLSFTKGCYRGQEIVNRIESLGHPPKTIVSFRAEGEVLPIESAPLFAPDDAKREPVGAVTSSAMSPMLSHTPIGLAMVKWNHAQPETQLLAGHDAGDIEVTVRPLEPFITSD